MDTRVVKRFLKYVSLDSESRNERKIADYLKEELENLGFEVKEDDAGKKNGGNTGNIIGILKGNPNKDSVLFSSHMDTVTPGVGIVPVIKDGIITSQGDTILGGDDKAGIASIIEGITKVLENNEDYGNIEIVFSVGEEIGLLGVKNLEFSNFKSKKAYILDSSGEVGGIVTSAPAQTKIKIEVTGKSAHAGIAPEKGISAISILAEAITNMKLLRIDEETTSNIGKISGGTATNIVSEYADALIEVRSLSMEKLKIQSDHIIEEAKKAAIKFGGTVNSTIDYLYPSYKHNEEDEVVVLAKLAMESIGIKGYVRSSGGGSDANIYNLNGIKAVNLNNGTNKVHTVDEYIAIDSLKKTSEIVRMIIVNS